MSRALLPFGEVAVRRGAAVLERVDLVRVNDRVLGEAGVLLPLEMRSLDAIHLATARLFEQSLSRFVTYDERLGDAARRSGLAVVAPS